MPTTRSTATRSEPAAAGLTLLELLVVMAIIATLLGLGLGGFRKLDTSDRQAVAQVKDALRAARLFARAQGAPASVVVDAEAGAVYGLGLTAVGNWHLEDDQGWPVPATGAGGSYVPGVLGSALRLEDQAELKLLDLPPSFDAPDGFGLDVFVAPAPDPRPMTILERPDAWAVGLDALGELELVLRLRPQSTGEAPEEFRVSLPDHGLSPERLRRLVVVFDGRRLHVSVDGLRIAEDTLFESRRALMTPAGAPIVSGREPHRFVGVLDELRISSVVVGDHEPLPPDVSLQGPTRVVHVGPAGHLDPDRHSAPEQVRMITGDPTVELTVEFGLLGTARSWSSRDRESMP